MARDSATNCAWQSFAGNPCPPLFDLCGADAWIGNLAAVHSAFPPAFSKMATIGHNPANLIDCSDVIPAAPPLPANAGPHLPAGQTHNDIEQAVSTPVRTTVCVLLMGIFSIVCYISIPDFHGSAGTCDHCPCHVSASQSVR